eukprot:5532605-Amphidinium_carterae.1
MPGSNQSTGGRQHSSNLRLPKGKANANVHVNLATTCYSPSATSSGRSSSQSSGKSAWTCLACGLSPSTAFGPVRCPGLSR